MPPPFCDFQRLRCQVPRAAVSFTWPSRLLRGPLHSESTARPLAVPLSRLLNQREALTVPFACDGNFCVIGLVFPPQGEPSTQLNWTLPSRISLPLYKLFQALRLQELVPSAEF